MSKLTSRSLKSEPDAIPRTLEWCRQVVGDVELKYWTLNEWLFAICPEGEPHPFIGADSNLTIAMMGALLKYRGWLRKEGAS